MSTQGWWHRATKAQRLAQLDGGIECGMSARHIAVASGLSEDKTTQLTVFGNRHGRKFPGISPHPVGGIGKHNSVHRLAQFRRGEPVDFWGNTQPADEFRLDDPESAGAS